MTRAYRSAIVVLAVLLVLPGCAGSSGADAEADVRATLESFYDAMKRADTTAAMAVIAPDAVFLESGRIETRDEYEKNHLPADIGFEKQVTGTRGAWTVTLEGDTAWVIGETGYEGTFDGTPVNFVSRQLAVLTRDAGTWLIRSIHWSSMRR